MVLGEPVGIADVIAACEAIATYVTTNLLDRLIRAVKGRVA
jgi:hypothetical protein